MEASEILPLLGDLESDRVERTVSKTDSDKFGEAICAFANDLPNSRKPGYLVVGVDDKGKVAGVEITDQLLQSLGSIRSQGNLQPPPSMTVSKVDLPGGSVAVAKVQPHPAPPVRYKGRVWVRVGPRRGIANEADELNLSEKRSAALSRTWDSRPNHDASLDELVLDLFVVTYRLSAISREVIEENNRSLERQLTALRFFDLKANVPTNAGVLLFGRDPMFFVPGAYVQYVRYGGDSRADEVLEDRRLSGDFLSILRGLDELARDIAVGRPVAREGLREEMLYDYPLRALRELFVNAVVHRNYEHATSPVLINHYADSLEILNPGGLFAGLSVDRFPEETAYRNPVLAEAAVNLGYANRYGRGIATAEAELEKNGSPAPEFSLDQPNFFYVKVGRRS